MRISARRKSVFESRPTGSKIRQTQRRRITAAALRVHPFRVNAAELARRKFLHLAAGAATLPAISRSAEAQAYPTRPITMVVPFPAGGNTDANARILAEQIRGLLGQPVIIENVSGADGSIGTGTVCANGKLSLMPTMKFLEFRLSGFESASKPRAPTAYDPRWQRRVTFGVL